MTMSCTATTIFLIFHFVTVKLTPHLTSQGGHFIPCTWHFGSSSRATSLKLAGCVDLQCHVLVIHAQSHLWHQWSPTTNAPHTAWHCGGSSQSFTISESGEPKTQSSLICFHTSHTAASLLPFCLTFWSLSGGRWIIERHFFPKMLFSKKEC